jgi:hypothetical protein
MNDGSDTRYGRGVALQDLWYIDFMKSILLALLLSPNGRKR